MLWDKPTRINFLLSKFFFFFFATLKILVSSISSGLELGLMSYMVSNHLPAFNMLLVYS